MAVQDATSTGPECEHEACGPYRWIGGMHQGPIAGGHAGRRSYRRRWRVVVPDLMERVPWGWTAPADPAALGPPYGSSAQRTRV